MLTQPKQKQKTVALESLKSNRRWSFTETEGGREIARNMSDDTPVTLSREGGRQLSPETWPAVQEELHDFLEEGKVTITPGGLRSQNWTPSPFARKRKKQPKNNPPGTHMLVESTADVLVQVEETLQRAIIPGLRVGRAKYRQSDFVAQRIM